MTVNTNFLVPVATADATPGLGNSEDLPQIGDVPHQCPAKGSSMSVFDSVAGYHHVTLPIEWKPNWTFRTGLKFRHISAYNNTCYVSLQDPSTGKCYRIHSDSFREMMSRSVWLHGLVVEDWTWEKRGRFIFLCPAYLAI